ncbi:hypothetical protein D3C80_1792920 [compost metagenome]
MVEEERCHVIVEDIEEDVGLFLIEPCLDWLEPFENWGPRRILLLVVVDREPDSGCMRDGEAADNTCHGMFLYLNEATGPLQPGLAAAGHGRWPGSPSQR